MEPENDNSGDRHPALIEWLNDRNSFHTWFCSLIIGSVVVLTAFGSQPDVNTFAGWLLIIAMIALLFAVVCNLICVWSIPAWKLKLRTQESPEIGKMQRELSVTAWLGVISFVTGLTLGFIGSVHVG